MTDVLCEAGCGRPAPRTRDGLCPACYRERVRRGLEDLELLLPTPEPTPLNQQDFETQVGSYARAVGAASRKRLDHRELTGPEWEDAQARIQRRDEEECEHGPAHFVETPLAPQDPGTTRVAREASDVVRDVEEET